MNTESPFCPILILGIGVLQKYYTASNLRKQATIFTANTRQSPGKYFPGLCLRLHVLGKNLEHQIFRLANWLKVKNNYLIRWSVWRT